MNPERVAGIDERELAALEVEEQRQEAAKLQDEDRRHRAEVARSSAYFELKTQIDAMLAALSAKLDEAENPIEIHRAQGGRAFGLALKEHYEGALASLEAGGVISEAPR